MMVWRKTFRTLLLRSSLVLLLVGCSTLTTKEPLSEDPEAVDREELEGAWVLNDQVYQVRFREDGVARIGHLAWENDEFFFLKGEMIITEGRLHNFLSIRGFGDGEWMDEYLLLGYTILTDGNLLLWVPDVDRFEELVAEGRLEGIIDPEDSRFGSDLMLTTPPAELLEFLNDPENEDLFDDRPPNEYREIFGDPENPDRVADLDPVILRKVTEND